ncbi:MAG TPA: N-formylglutamate amidohydrolase [Chryseosolibacter sp.]|nr:N-formylglutamate amidohydrolase [Chryseosolibacter sp.]
MSKDSFKVTRPRGKQIPIIVSVPHCGTQFPDELIDEYKPEYSAAPDDTDWFVDRLYDFAPSMGITMICACYSRWVVDLNRDPDSRPLYTDGRIITGLCPTTDFLGNKIYRDERSEVSKQEIERRVNLYYNPYHHKLRQLIDELHATHDQVLLWDCHSIRQHVPTISAEKFPDLILGSADEQSASPQVIQTALDNLSSAIYKLSHNHPFKGGYITRHFGEPLKGVHALQLEMCKVHYMDDTETKYDRERADKMRDLLTSTFERLDEIISA